MDDSLTSINAESMNTDRSWMWRRLDNNGYLSTEFIEGVPKFLDFAYEHPRFMSDDTIKCPCSKCRNTKFLDRSGVHHHLYRPLQEWISPWLQFVENELKRPVDEFEPFEHTYKSKSTGEFINRKSQKISEEYRAKRGCTDSDSSPPEFDAVLWKRLVGETTKGHVYGVVRSHVFGGYMSQSTVNSTFMNDDISKVADDGRASIMQIEEEARKKEEEREKRLERALEEVRKREEEVRKREEEVRKIVEEAKKIVEEANKKAEQNLQQKME